MKRMKPFPNNPSEEDRRTYRRWTGGLFLVYLVAVTVAVGVTFMGRSSGDLRASNEQQMARLKSVPGTMAIAPSARPLTMPQ
ncbi:hypothetical protein LJR220_000009 [Bradyrhizobium sp. LjRoot220]|uniref:hypothetical protein n=1 Tax=Bradyrhizobium sp. LjRoot220 TaxID=3342284 RepID=UPI003ED0E9A8